MLADADSLSFLISAKQQSGSLLVFEGEGDVLVFESFFGPILSDYIKKITKLITFSENCVSWYVLLSTYFIIQYM